MRLIKSNNVEPEYPKHHICDECGAELECDKEGAHIGWHGYEYVTCPACDSETMADKCRVQPPTWKTTFHHHNAETCKNINDDKVQRIISQTFRILKSADCDDGESYITSVGNLLVFGIKHDEGKIEVFVTKDYYTDNLLPEDYGMVK